MPHVAFHTGLNAPGPVGVVHPLGEPGAHGFRAQPFQQTDQVVVGEAVKTHEGLPHDADLRPLPTAIHRDRLKLDHRLPEFLGQTLHRRLCLDQFHQAVEATAIDFVGVSWPGFVGANSGQCSFQQIACAVAVPGLHQGVASKLSTVVVELRIVTWRKERHFLHSEFVKHYSM
ncbi:MAG: hypothetical protein EA424_06465 [Planctomycetaceae bacterium]|nr:MAG: hypothetical protein EA424_06465 [Planctomycetaceae bacterium]